MDHLLQKIERSLLTSREMDKKCAMILLVASAGLTLFAIFSRVTSLTFTEIIFVCKTVQASRIIKTWAAEAWVILIRRKDTSLVLLEIYFA